MSALYVWPYSKSLSVGAVVVLGVLGDLLAGGRGLAQPVPDNTLGSESSVVSPIVDLNAVDVIPVDDLSPIEFLVTGGATRGAGGSLFHSFETFDVGETPVYFEIENVGSIITRVTGGGVSNINGTLGVRRVDGSVDGADFYFLNPNGVVIGPDAVLDIRGPLTISTSNRFDLSFDGIFSAVEPSRSNLVDGIPLGVQRNNLPQGDITTQGGLSTFMVELQTFSTGNGGGFRRNSSLDLYGQNIEIQDESFNFIDGSRVNVLSPNGSISLRGVKVLSDVQLQSSFATGNIVFQGQTVRIQDVQIDSSDILDVNIAASSGSIILENISNNALNQNSLIRYEVNSENDSVEFDDFQGFISELAINSENAIRIKNSKFTVGSNASFGDDFSTSPISVELLNSNIQTGFVNLLTSRADSNSPQEINLEGSTLRSSDFISVGGSFSESPITLQLSDSRLQAGDISIEVGEGSVSLENNSLIQVENCSDCQGITINANSITAEADGNNDVLVTQAGSTVNGKITITGNGTIEDFTNTPESSDADTLLNNDINDISFSGSSGPLEEPNPPVIIDNQEGEDPIVIDGDDSVALPPGGEPVEPDSDDDPIRFDARQLSQAASESIAEDEMDLVVINPSLAKTPELEPVVASCAIDSGDSDTFVVSGQGGLPPQAGDLAAGRSVNVPWVTASSQSSVIQGTENEQSSPRYASATPLIEAQSLVVDAQGHAYFVAKVEQPAAPQSQRLAAASTLCAAYN